MRYAVDLTRGVFYAGSPEYDKVVIDSPLLNIGIVGGLFAFFLAVGMALFVRGERYRSSAGNRCKSLCQH